MTGITIGYLAFLFVLGLTIGSFSNVLIWRIPQQMPFAKGRSICPKCNNHLKAADLVPVFSYLFLRGKCRYCKEPISARYPLVELVTGVLFAVCGLRYNPFADFGAFWEFEPMLLGQLAVALVVTVVLLVICMIDFDTMEIPNGLVLFLAIPAIAAIFTFNDVSLLWDRVIGAFCVSLPMYILCLIIPNAFGGGDIKLYFVCGFLLGWKNTLLATFIALLLGGGYAIYLILSRKIESKGHIPFGPYICVGVWVALLYGHQLVDAYTGYFFG